MREVALKDLSLGPLSGTFFLMTFSYFQDNFKSVKILGYVDDLLVLVPAISPEKVAKKPEKILNLIYNKLNEMKLKLNISKTQICNFSRYKNSCLYNPGNISLNGEIIPPSNNITYLGIIFDEVLNFNKHIEATINKCR